MRPDTATSSGFHAVFLENNLVVIGQLSGYGGRHPVLKDVFYVRQNVNPETKAVSNVLVRRGGEWHGPDRMVINPDHILFIEPVSKGSRVDQLIQEVKSKGQ
ncbi:MAG: hypothetical protein NTZ56_18360 [Acidobacteria bacterium]|nr:hypothetical protein [Acidobacteriota bacterium]